MVIGWNTFTVACLYTYIANWQGHTYTYFMGKDSQLSDNPRKPPEFSPSNILPYTYGNLSTYAVIPKGTKTLTVNNMADTFELIGCQ